MQQFYSYKIITFFH